MKQQRRDQRLSEIDQEREQERYLRAKRSAEVEERRRSRVEAAHRDEERVRENAIAKLNATDKRTNNYEVEKQMQRERDDECTARVAARREEAYRQGMAVAEQKRREAEYKFQMSEDMHKQREGLKSIQMQIKAEEDFLRDQKRQATKLRSEQELANRRLHMEERMRMKDSLLHLKKRELEAIQVMKTEESRQRSSALQQSVRYAAERDAADRERMGLRVAGKMQRATAITEQREQLMSEMGRMRQRMAMQEGAIRSDLEKLRRGGNSYAVSQSVLQSLEQYQSQGGGGGGSSPNRQRYITSLASPRTPAAPHGGGMAHGSPNNYTPEGQQHSAASYGTNDTPNNYAQNGRPKSAVPSRAHPAYYSGSPTRNQNNGYSPSAAPMRPYSASAGKRAHHTAVGSPGSRYPPPQQAYYTTAGTAPDPVSRREEELRHVLEEEISKESKRQYVLMGVTEEMERMRLTRMFTLEREQAKARIIVLTHEVPKLPITLPNFKNPEERCQSPCPVSKTPRSERLVAKAQIIAITHEVPKLPITMPNFKNPEE
eukprot:gene22728-29890_t